MLRHLFKRKSIFIELQGGVGNQLFQFVAALFLANLRKKRLELGVGSISGNSHLGSTITGIECFRYTSKIMGFTAIKDTPNLKKPERTIINRLKIKYALIFHFAIVQNSEVGFEESILHRRHISRLRGYFQSFYYFDELIDKGMLRKSDLLQEGKSIEFGKIKSFILENNPIIIHVRAGDYMIFRETIGVLSPEYYKSAVEEIPNYREREILLFTDNPDYAAKVMSDTDLNFTFFSETSTMHPMEVITLMSYGSDFIISNSTFSWWGAKLSPEKGIIVAPMPWFRERAQPLNLIPTKWITHRSRFLE